MSEYLKKIFQIPNLQQNQPLQPSQLYKYKTRFSMLGTVGSGKTTIGALLVLTQQTLSARLPGFTCRTLEGSGNILQATSDLRRGRFPPKTPSDSPYAYESGCLMRWTDWKGGKQIHVPLCDIAGEDLEGMIRKFGTGMYTPGLQMYNAACNLINYVKDSDGFVLSVPASKALILPDDQQLDHEGSEVSADPDVNLTRILEAVLSHKEQTHGKQIKGIAVVITKWDVLMPYAVMKGMDLYDPTGNGIQNFMDSCFPALSSLLKNYGFKGGQVRFFPSYVTVEREGDGAVKRWPDGSERIKTDLDEPNPKRIPKYAEDSYVRLIDWLKLFAS